MILAAAMLVFACGGNSGKKETVEQKAARFATELCEAEAAGDYDEVQKIRKEMLKWAKGLSEEEVMEAEAAYMDAVDEWVANYDEEEEWDEEAYYDEEAYCDEEAYYDEGEEWDEEEYEF